MIHNYNKYLQQLLLPISTNNTLTTTAINNNTVNHKITYRTVDITLIPPFLLSLIANYQPDTTFTTPTTPLHYCHKYIFYYLYHMTILPLIIL